MSNGFYGVHSIGDHLLLNQLEENIDNYLDYNFQKIGGWVNVNIPRASIRKNLLHQELVEFTTRSGLLLDLDTASLCEQYNNDGPLPCTDLSAYPNPYIRSYTYNSNDIKTFNVIFDAYGAAEALKISISGSAGVLDLIDTGMIIGATSMSQIDTYIENGVRKYLYSDRAFIDTITKPTGYETLTVEITNDSSDCINKGLTGHYFSICELKELVEIIESNNNCKSMINVSFTPSIIANTGVTKRLRILASGTNLGSTLSMLDTGFTNDISNYSLIKPTGYDKILFYLDSNGYHLYPSDIKADYTDLCSSDLERTFDTTTNEEDYLLNFDAFTDTKKIKIFANSGSSSTELLDTGYISGTNTGLLDCLLGANPGDNASYISFNKPAGYDSITIQFDENNRYDDAFYISVYTETDVSAPDNTSLYGDLPHQLKTTEVPGYKLGQVWQAFRKDWVHETGIVYFPQIGYCENYSPINISGVYINSTFVPGPTGIATTGYHINYPLGQIIFDKPLSKTAKVEMDYSYKWCQIYKDSTDPYWKELQELTYKPIPSINQTNKGDYSLSANHRIQMPAIIVESISNSETIPAQLGRKNWWTYQDILMHVFTENAGDRNKIADIMRLQKESTITLYDINKVVNSGIYSLNYQGEINSSGLGYYDLITNSAYRWNSSFIKDVQIIDMESRNKNIFWCTIRLTTETILP